MFDIFSVGGLIMAVIIACALIATFIIFERSFYYSNLRKKDALIFEHAKAYAKIKQYDKAAIISDVDPPPFSSNAFKERILTFGATPTYFPLEEYPLPAIIPATCVPWPLSS